MRIPLSLDVRRSACEEDSKWALKAVLRIGATLSALIAVIMYAVAVSLTNANFINTMGNGDWTDGLALAPVSIALIYDPTSLALQFVARKGRPLHPSVHVGLDLLVWGLSVPATIFGVAGGMFWYWTDGLPSDDGAIDCSFFFNAWTQRCTPVAYDIGRLEVAGLVFGFLVFALHLILFVFACFDLHRWRLAANYGSQSGFDMQYRKDPERQSQGS